MWGATIYAMTQNKRVSSEPYWSLFFKCVKLGN